MGGEHERPDRRAALRRLRRRLLEAPESPEDAEFRRRHWSYAGGGVICDTCGDLFYDHPADPVEESLTIICTRERVKL